MWQIRLSGGGMSAHTQRRVASSLTNMFLNVPVELPPAPEPSKRGKSQGRSSFKKFLTDNPKLESKLSRKTLVQSEIDWDQTEEGQETTVFTLPSRSGPQSQQWSDGTVVQVDNNSAGGDHFDWTVSEDSLELNSFDTISMTGEAMGGSDLAETSPRRLGANTLRRQRGALLAQRPKNDASLQEKKLDSFRGKFVSFCGSFPSSLEEGDGISKEMLSEGIIDTGGRILERVDSRTDVVVMGKDPDGETLEVVAAAQPPILIQSPGMAMTLIRTAKLLDEVNKSTESHETSSASSLFEPITPKKLNAASTPHWKNFGNYWTRKDLQDTSSPSIGTVEFDLWLGIHRCYLLLDRRKELPDLEGELAVDMKDVLAGRALETALTEVLATKVLEPTRAEQEEQDISENQAVDIDSLDNRIKKGSSFKICNRKVFSRDDLMQALMVALPSSTGARRRRVAKQLLLRGIVIGTGISSENKSIINDRDDDDEDGDVSDDELFILAQKVPTHIYETPVVKFPWKGYGLRWTSDVRKRGSGRRRGQEEDDLFELTLHRVNVNDSDHHSAPLVSCKGVLEKHCYMSILWWIGCHFDFDIFQMSQVHLETRASLNGDMSNPLPLRDLSKVKSQVAIVKTSVEEQVPQETMSVGAPRSSQLTPAMQKVVADFGIELADLDDVLQSKVDSGSVGKKDSEPKLKPFNYRTVWDKGVSVELPPCAINDPEVSSELVFDIEQRLFGLWDPSLRLPYSYVKMLRDSNQNGGKVGKTQVIVTERAGDPVRLSSEDFSTAMHRHDLSSAVDVAIAERRERKEKVRNRRSSLEEEYGDDKQSLYRIRSIFGVSNHEGGIVEVNNSLTLLAGYPSARLDQLDIAADSAPCGLIYFGASSSALGLSETDEPTTGKTDDLNDNNSLLSSPTAWAFDYRNICVMDSSSPFFEAPIVMVQPAKVGDSVGALNRDGTPKEFLDGEFLVTKVADSFHDFLFLMTHPSKAELQRDADYVSWFGKVVTD